jgi:plastocyanin
VTRTRSLVPILLAVTAAGCGRAGESPRPAGAPSGPPSVPASTAQTTPPAEASCPPKSVSLVITAKDLKFDKDCLTVPAHKPFKVRFINADVGVLHNFTIHGQSIAETFLAGKVITGPKTITSTVKGLKAGEYLFHCDVHPAEMQGTLLVAG